MQSFSSFDSKYVQATYFSIFKAYLMFLTVIFSFLETKNGSPEHWRAAFFSLADYLRINEIAV